MDTPNQNKTYHHEEKTDRNIQIDFLNKKTIREKKETKKQKITKNLNQPFNSIESSQERLSSENTTKLGIIPQNKANQSINLKIKEIVSIKSDKAKQSFNQKGNSILVESLSSKSNNLKAIKLYKKEKLKEWNIMIIMRFNLL